MRLHHSAAPRLEYCVLFRSLHIQEGEGKNGEDAAEGHQNDWSIGPASVHEERLKDFSFFSLESKRLGGNIITVFQYREDKGISFTEMHSDKRQHT